MSTSREILESTYRAGRMKKVRTFVYSSHAVLAIILLIILALLTEGAGSYIFVIPVEMIVFVLALIILIVNIETFFFKYFGLKYAKTDSEKFLMSKGYIKKGFIIIVAAVIILALTFIIVPLSEKNIDSTENAVIVGDYNTTFKPRDPFGAVDLKKIIVTQDETQTPLDIYILGEDDFISGFIGKRLNIKEEQSVDIPELEYEINVYLSQEVYVLYINSRGALANVTYTLDREISKPLVMYLTLFPITFIVANAAWSIYLLPIKKRYKKTSIYT